MRIAFATSECVPFVKTGGLADVSGALPKALAAEGNEVKVFLPLYNSINTINYGLSFAHELYGIPAPIGGETVHYHVWYKKDISGVEFYFIDCPRYYHRTQIYTTDPDEDNRYILLQNAVLQILQRFNWAPDILHCNDWQTALLPVYLREKYGWDSLFWKTGSVLSIHNLAYQGLFSKEAIYHAGLHYDKFYPTGPYEFHNAFSFLKAGMVYADVLTTVSETYAREIQTPDYGERLDGVLAVRRDDLFGILNGIDPNDWNPRVDKLIPQHYDPDNFADKIKNKRALLEQMGLPFDENVPTIGMITRLTVQKGLEILSQAFNELMQMPVQLVILGSGEKKYEDFLRWAANTHPGKVSAYIGFNNALAHLITAGCDMYLMPSRYEPCGLNQMYSLNYGTVPIVRKTGGLADTVRDYHEFDQQGNGFSFWDFTPYALYTSVHRALELFHQKDVWMEIVKRGMSEDFSWQQSARKYMEVYRRAKSKRGG
jgi:starch synthase